MQAQGYGHKLSNTITPPVIRTSKNQEAPPSNNANPPHTTQHMAKQSILQWVGAPTQHCNETPSADALVKRVKLNLCYTSISPATADNTTSTDAPLRVAEEPLDKGQGKTVTDNINNTIEPNKCVGAQSPGIHAIMQPTRRSAMPGGTPWGDCNTIPGEWPKVTPQNTQCTPALLCQEGSRATPTHPGLLPPTLTATGYPVVGADKKRYRTEIKAQRMRQLATHDPKTWFHPVWDSILRLHKQQSTLKARLII
jgi:hypothetical protein